MIRRAKAALSRWGAHHQRRRPWSAVARRRPPRVAWCLVDSVPPTTTTPGSRGFDPLLGFDPATIGQLTGFYRDRLTMSLTQIKGARPGTARGDAVLEAAVRLVEELLSQISISLNSQFSQLRQELRLKDISVTALEKQVSACNVQILEFNRTKKPGFIRATLKGLGAVALAIGASVAGQATTHALDSNSPALSMEVAGPGNLRELALACEVLDSVIEELGGYSAGSSQDQTELDLSNAGGTTASDGEHDEWPNDLDWFDIQDAEGGYELGGDISGVEGAVWRAKGFTPTDATEWHMAGMDPESAAEWAGAGFEAFEADAWRLQAFDPATAAGWHAAELSPGAARDFGLAGFTPDEAREWYVAEIDPFDAKNWQDKGFDADDAAYYESRELSPEDAAKLQDGDID